MPNAETDQEYKLGDCVCMLHPRGEVIKSDAIATRMLNPSRMAATKACRAGKPELWPREGLQLPNY